LILVLAAWLGAIACVCGWAIVVGRPPRVAGGAALPRAVLVRPCAGDEPELARCLSSWPSLPAGAALGVVFAVADASDAALPVARAAAEALGARGVDARVVLTPAGGPNRKAAQLAAAVDAAGDAEVVVVADSDVDLEGLDLTALIAPVAADDRVAACWAPPVERGAARTLGDRASQALLGASLHAFPILARLDRRGMVGKLVALRRRSLAAAGGFASLAGVLGEDVELARRFARRGEAVAVAAVTAPSLASGRDLGDVVARYARWLTVVRRQRPALLLSYPLLFAATPIASSIAIACRAPWLAAAFVALRLATARLACAACGRRRSLAGALADAGLADALLLAAFARAIAARSVVWRGSRLRVLSGGRLAAEP
jgi:ceramide glucosyltransferase